MPSFRTLLPLTLVLSALTLSAHADTDTEDAKECLAVEDEHFEVEISELGFGEGLWEANVVNQCDRDFDARIEIELLDAEGDKVTSYTAVAVIPAHNAEAISKDMHLTSSDAERIEEANHILSGSRQPF